MRGRTKSLRRRVFWGFTVCAAGIWVAFVVWFVHTMLSDGQRSVADALSTYAEQLMVPVQRLADQPEALVDVVRGVVEIENRPTPFDDEPDPLEVQIWLGTELLYSSAALPVERPTAGFAMVTVEEDQWWTHTLTSPDGEQSIRLWGLSGFVAALRTENLAVFFLPLLFSLPVLLIPAWYMTRSGLQPLRDVVAHIEQRVLTDNRTPLPATPYEELNPIVDAANSLMARLDAQLVRERTFAADVAHEMKTPLAIVQANVDILAGAPDPAQREQALANLRAGIARSDRLVAQLLQLMRLERGADLQQSEEAVDLAEFVRKRVGQLEPLARRRRISLSVSAPDRLRGHIDLNAFSAIVDNLLDNAIKYGPSGSEVRVALKNENGQAELQVTDAGGGIPEALRERAFDRFERLKQVDAAGAGLGLAIVREAVARLNGRLTFSEAAGWSIVVRFRLQGVR